MHYTFHTYCPKGKNLGTMIKHSWPSEVFLNFLNTAVLVKPRACKIDGTRVIGEWQTFPDYLPTYMAKAWCRGQGDIRHLPPHGKAMLVGYVGGRGSGCSSKGKIDRTGIMCSTGWIGLSNHYNLCSGLTLLNTRGGGDQRKHLSLIFRDFWNIGFFHISG